MGDSLQAGKPSRYVTSHSVQLSLATPLWIGATILAMIRPPLVKKMASSA